MYLKNSLWAILAFCALFLSVLTGGIVGAVVGGNHFTDLQAFGLGGYEVTGIIGAMMAVIPGSVLAYLIVRRSLP